MMRFVPILAVLNLALSICSIYLAMNAISFFAGSNGDIIGAIAGLNRQNLFFWDFVVSILTLVTGVFFCFRRTHESRYYGPLMLTACGIASIFYSLAIFDFKAWTRIGWQLNLLDIIGLFVLIVGFMNLVFALTAWRRTFFTAAPSLPDDPEAESV